ncbi:hypothetical protein F4823DRAFT_631605 [Ustulina deusta]|nr:hypothetical protein F4823DRAFT_631605 [Ustulina deusta]
MPSLKNYLELLGENFKFELSRQPGPPSDRRYEDIGRCITVVTWKNIFEDLCKLAELTQQLNVPPTTPDLTENERLIWNEGKFQPTHERLWCHPANQLLKEIFPDSHYDVLPFLPLYELFPDATFVNQKVDLEVHDTNNGRNAIFESKFHGVLPSGDSVKETQSLTLSSLGQICHYCMLSGTAIGVVITTVELIFIQITTEMNTDEVAQAMSEDMSETASEANPQTPPMIRKRASEWPSPATQTVRTIPDVGEEMLEPFDFIVVTTKNIPDVPPTVGDIIAPAVTPGKTAIVLSQNGLNIEKPLIERFPTNPIVSSKIGPFASSGVAPGVAEEAARRYVAAYNAAGQLQRSTYLRHYPYRPRVRSDKDL